MKILESKNGYFEIGSFFLRRLLDLSFQSICLSLERNLAAPSQLRILDVGAGRRPYLPLFENCSYRSLDPHETLVDYKSFKDIPPSETYDVILLLECLEHVEEPSKVLDSIQVLMQRNPKSELWISVPYGVRFHMEPQDYWRWTDEGLKRFLESQNLKIVEGVVERGGDFVNLVARLNVFFFVRLKNPLFWVFIVIYALSVFPFLMLLAQLDLRWPWSRKGDPLGLFVRCRR
jgi:hypothetical protein